MIFIFASVCVCKQFVVLCYTSLSNVHHLLLSTSSLQVSRYFHRLQTHNCIFTKLLLPHPDISLIVTRVISQIVVASLQLLGLNNFIQIHSPHFEIEKYVASHFEAKNLNLLMYIFFDRKRKLRVSNKILTRNLRIKLTVILDSAISSKMNVPI